MAKIFIILIIRDKKSAVASNITKNMQNISLTTIITFYLVIINVFTFFLYGVDKWKAQRSRWRIPESVYWGQRRGMVEYARMAPQNPTCEVPLWCTDYSDSAGSVVGVDFYDKIKFIYPLFYPKILCTFAH